MSVELNINSSKYYIPIENIMDSIITWEQFKYAVPTSINLEFDNELKILCNKINRNYQLI